MLETPFIFEQISFNIFAFKQIHLCVKSSKSFWLLENQFYFRPNELEANIFSYLSSFLLLHFSIFSHWKVEQRQYVLLPTFVMDRHPFFVGHLAIPILWLLTWFCSNTCLNYDKNKISKHTNPRLYFSSWYQRLIDIQFTYFTSIDVVCLLSYEHLVVFAIKFLSS